MAKIDDELEKKPWKAPEFRPQRTEILDFIHKKKLPVNKKTIGRIGRKLRRKKWRESLPVGKDVSISESDSPRLLVYGTARVGGTITFFDSTNRNQYAHYVISIAGMEVEDIEKLYLNNEEVLFASVPGFSNSNSFGGKVYFSKSLGADDQVVNAELAANDPAKWTSTCRQRGVAHAYIKLVWDSAYWDENPEFSFQVKGKKVYDHRVGTTVFTSNAALIIADYMTNARYGLGLTYSDLDVSTNEGGLQWAADICDELVSVASGGSEPRYTINGWFPQGRKHKEVLEEMVACMAGMLTFQGGLWRFWPAKWRTPVMTLTENDVRSPIRVKTINARRDLFNSVRGTFVDKNGSFEVTDFPVVKNSLYISEDNGEQIFEEVDYPLVTSSSTAQRLSKIALEQVRQGINVQATWSLKAYQLEVPDNIYLTLPRYGWVEKPFQVIECELVQDTSGGGPTYSVFLNLQETASGIYDWNNGDETTVDLSPNTNLPDPFSVSPPSGLELASGTEHLYTRSDGTIFSRLYASWDAMDDFFVSSGGRIEVQYKKTADSDWQNASPVTGDSTFTYILDVQDGVAYDLRIRAVNAFGIPSAWDTETEHIVVGKTALPSDVQGLTATLDGFGITVKWLKVPDLDVKKYIVKLGDEDDSWGDSIELARVDSTSYRLAVQAANAYKFQIKALDSSGNESENPAAIIVTVSTPAAPTGLNYSLTGENVTVRWNAVPATELFAISDYVVLYGNAYETALTLATTKALHWAQKADWGGMRRFWILARDVAGNVGAAAAIDITITPPTAVASFTNQVIDNNVLLKWVEPTTHSLPIDYYAIYKGDTFATAEHLGDMKVTFTAYFEIIAGTYTYWVVPVDTAGNLGPESGSPAVVSEPPDFEVRDDAVYAPDEFDTVINAVIEGETFVLPAYPSTLQEKFLGYEWETFDDQIGAGYPIVIEPSVTYAVIEKIIDYGTVLPGTLVTASWLKEILDEDIDITCTLGYSNDGVTFTDTVDVTQIYAVDFQYIKIRLEIGDGTGSGSPMGLLLSLTGA